jgi:hypothetical protein
MWGRSLLLLVFAVPALAGSPKPTRITWRFENIVEGYDHIHQMVVEADGVEVATSEEMNESTPGSMSVTLPEGASTLRIVSMAMYEGFWEEHTIDNDYAVDCLWEIDLGARPPKKIDLVCDIDEGARKKVR